MLFENINKKFGLKLFKNPNTLNYNLFNMLFKLNDANFNQDIDLTNYHKTGFLKTSIDSFSLASFLSEEIKKQKPEFKEKVIQLAKEIP